MGLRECHESDIVLLVPEDTHSGSDDIAGIERTVMARLKGLGTPCVDHLLATSYYRTISTNKYQN